MMLHFIVGLAALAMTALLAKRGSDLRRKEIYCVLLGERDKADLCNRRRIYFYALSVIMGLCAVLMIAQSFNS